MYWLEDKIIQQIPLVRLLACLVQGLSISEEELDMLYMVTFKFLLFPSNLKCCLNLYEIKTLFLSLKKKKKLFDKMSFSILEVYVNIQRCCYK